ncbi:MAG: 4'-phosphopantetheinyl transferase superfamily protein [Candidatus Symbiothrix sp.]|jgi:phosphopantetheinyl transferase (holo-ACP synthase)|nr:4'-phosphopantetheinyl transferase superfamily protein [Candidatus Symbiothrix sp.]
MEFLNRRDKLDIWTFFISRSKIGIALINKDSETLLSQMEHKDRYLPVIEKMTEKRKCEWLTVRTLLKTLSGEEKEIAYQSNRKPYLTDRSYHVSISHTNYKGVRDDNLSGYVAMILNEEKEVAIDIEMISPRVLKIKERFLSREEAKAISSGKEIVHLLLHWSAKESIFKILDAEDVDYQSKIHILPFEPVIGVWGSFEAYETRTEKQCMFLIHYFVHENYVLTVIG